MSVANILFVDDSSLIRKLISEILASWSVYRELEAQGFAAVMKKDFDQDALRTVIRNIVGS